MQRFRINLGVRNVNSIALVLRQDLHLIIDKLVEGLSHWRFLVAASTKMGNLTDASDLIICELCL